MEQRHRFRMAPTTIHKIKRGRQAVRHACLSVRASARCNNLLSCRMQSAWRLSIALRARFPTVSRSSWNRWRIGPGRLVDPPPGSLGRPNLLSRGREIITDAAPEARPPRLGKHRHVTINRSHHRRLTPRLAPRPEKMFRKYPPRSTKHQAIKNAQMPNEVS